VTQRPLGGTVVDNPVSPKDVLATVYHLLGIDLETTLTDRLGRPQPLAPGASIVREVLG
jgi:arylsulfatase A-like enzyme